MTDGTGTRTISYNANLQPSGEMFPSAFFGGRILTRTYDSLNRPTGFALGTSSDPAADHAVTYGYDTAGRLATVQDPSRTWTYSFVANSASLLSGVTSGNYSVTYSYEPGRNAITSVTNAKGNTTVSAFTYTNNAIGQRTARSQGGTAFAGAATESFGYNAKGEVTSSTHSGNSTRNTAFDYDGIGNRNWAAFAGGNTTYTANVLNQYSEVDLGTPVTPTYDDDGNMLSDGAGKRLVWDGENRLVEVRDASNNLIATYTYDGQSRRVKKVTSSLAPQGVTEEVYVYDGWNRIAMYSLHTSSFNLHTSYTWGRDLSGSLEGAGGVGGLLGIKEGANSYRVSYDANGNVSELIAATGNMAAHYEYDPFGNVVVATGSYAADNPWRFSTKPVDLETGYSYYGYRFYNPVDGRWVNRDPIEEEGGMNLYGFVGNDAIERTDALGLKWDTLDFLGYFYLGKGKPINLSPIGYLQDVKAEIKKQGILDRFQKKRGTGSIEDEARKTGPKAGSFKADFKNSYNFSRVHFVFGSITLSGEFFGHIECKDGKFEYKGEAIIIFEDLFEDLLDLKDHKNPSPIVNAQLQPISNLGGAPYWIIEGWIEKFDGKL